MVAMLKRQTQPTRLVLEATLGVEQLAAGQSRVDREHGVIRGVKVVGLRSRNRARVLGFLPGQWGDAADKPYEYSLEALRQAVSLYENASVYSDHPQFGYDDQGRRVMPPPDVRSNRDLVGWLENCHVVETGNPDVDGIYGDFHLVKTHELAAGIFEIADRNASKLGLSHEALWNDPKVVDGRIVLNRIDEVFAVALVSVRPGTTNGLFESESNPFAWRGKPAMRHTFKQIMETHKALTPARLAFEMLGDATMAPMGDVQVEVADGADADGQIKAAFRAAIMAVFDDESLDTAATLKRFKEILTAYDKVEGGGESETEKPAEKGTTSESAARPAQQPTDRSGIAIECVSLLNGAGIPSTPTVIESMMGLADKPARERYVRELGALRVAGSPPPRSSAGTATGHRTVAESSAGDVKPKALSIDEMAAAFRG